MEELIERIVRENVALRTLLGQIEDYMTENVSADDFPIFVSIDPNLNQHYIDLRNSIAMLMEDASEEVKEKIHKELTR